MILELESQSTTVLKCLFSIGIVTSLLKRERVGTFIKKMDLEVAFALIV